MNKNKIVKEVIIFLFVISIVSAGCPDEMVSYWKLDESSGLTAEDEMSNYPGVLIYGPVWVAGKVNNGLKFDGNNDFVNVRDVSELNSVNEFTIIGWVAQRDHGEQRIFDKIKDGNNDISIAPYNGKLYFELGNGANTYGVWNNYSSEIPLWTWYHLAAVYDGNAATDSQKIKLYINGDAKPLDFYGGPIPSTTSALDGFNLTFSRRKDDFNGTLDEIALFNKALSQSEIQDYYGRGLNEEDLCEDQQEEHDLKVIPVKTCTGEGELFVYQINPFQEISTSFTTARDELLIFTRTEAVFEVELNGVPALKSLVKSETSPFGVKIYKVETSPGDEVNITDSHIWASRGIQGYIAQDSSNPVYDLGSFELVYDGFETNSMSLFPGNYNYVFFDKYTFNNDGTDDSRKLNIKIDGPSGNVVNKTYTKPFPSPAEGVVMDDFNVLMSGIYNMTVDTEDSVYWMLVNCGEQPFCGNGIIEEGEECEDDSDCREGNCIDCVCIPEETFCGNGIVEEGEQCDDGNSNNNDACRNDCTLNCVDEDNDCVCDDVDLCLDSLSGEPVDADGCDPFQFCGKKMCGTSCEELDFRPVLQNCEEIQSFPEEVPYDCTTVVIAKEGSYYPRCTPRVCAD